MPRRVSPSPELREPYEQHLYVDLRHELSVRHIGLRSGPQRVSKRTGFIAALRHWDRAHGLQSAETPASAAKTPAPAARTRAKTAKKNPAKRKKQPQPRAMASTRVIRARRGCRFRLINVLLSPAFNDRWAEMVADETLDANRLWTDVHAAFVAQNEMLDALHFQDALFVNVTPNVILPHSAARLLQMWAEIATMYRNAVAQAKEAAAHNDNVHSFFDFCAGRLDLLYLHMAMLLEPKLYEFIMSNKIPAADPFSRSKPKPEPTAAASTTTTTSTVANEAKQRTEDSKPEATVKAPTPASAKPAQAKPALGKAKASSASPLPPAAAAPATVVAAPTAPATVVVAPAAPATMVIAPGASVHHSKPSSGLPTQNPEMEEPPALADAKILATVAPPPKMTAAPKAFSAKASKAGAKAKQTKPVAPPHKLAAHKKAAGKVKAATGAGAVKEAKQTASPSKEKQTSSPSKLKALSKTAQPKAPCKLPNRKYPVSEKPVSAPKVSNGKRRREEGGSTAIVEVPSVSDIVPHSSKRAHTTTTISTTLAARPSDMMLPPDEWDILENRLRKVNENIDRCHRGLASVEGNVSESYKQSLEADLRFYSAIKQRLQEQLLVVMQSGY